MQKEKEEKSCKIRRVQVPHKNVVLFLRKERDWTGLGDPSLVAAQSERRRRKHSEAKETRNACPFLSRFSRKKVTIYSDGKRWISCTNLFVEEWYVSYCTSVVSAITANESTKRLVSGI